MIAPRTPGLEKSRRPVRSSVWCGRSVILAAFPASTIRGPPDEKERGGEVWNGSRLARKGQGLPLLGRGAVRSATQRRCLDTTISPDLSSATRLFLRTPRATQTAPYASRIRRAPTLLDHLALGSPWLRTSRAERGRGESGSGAGSCDSETGRRRLWGKPPLDSPDS